jgi:hypothetical protein
VEATLRARITELEENLEATHFHRENMETTLRGRITELEEKLDRNSERKLVEAILRSQIKEMGRQRKEAETIVCAEIDKPSENKETTNQPFSAIGSRQMVESSRGLRINHPYAPRT